MRVPRSVVAVSVIAHVVALVGGSLLYVYMHANVATNSRFICAFGSAIAAEPLAPRNAETGEEFRTRVTRTRQFVRDIESSLDDCEQPTVIALTPEAREQLDKEKARERAREGDASNAQPGNSQPGPDEGPSTPGENPPPSGGPPDPPDEPPDDPGLLEPVCDLTGPLLELPVACD